MPKPRPACALRYGKLQPSRSLRDAVHFAELPDDAEVSIQTVTCLLDCSVKTVESMAHRCYLPEPIRDGGPLRWTVGPLREALRRAGWMPPGY